MALVTLQANKPHAAYPHDRFAAAARRRADFARQGGRLAEGWEHQPVRVQPDPASVLARSFRLRRLAGTDSRAAEHEFHASACRRADSGRHAAGRHRRHQHPDAAPGRDHQRR